MAKALTILSKIFIPFLFILLINFSTTAQNQPEVANPLTDIEIVRKVIALDIEGELYEDVTIYLKSKNPNLLSEKYKVKVKVVDKNGKSIYKKTYKNAFLYVFSNGQIQVGRKNFNQIIISKSTMFNRYTGTIREKEGVF